MYTNILIQFKGNKLKGIDIKSLKYIDLFCGAGGFSLGFQNSKFNNIFALDIEEKFCNTYKENFPNHNLIKKDITQLTKEEILTLREYQDIDVIIGGPPCQGFSIAGNIGRKFIDDPRNRLFKEFVRVVDIVKPKYFIMENVARLYTHNKHQTRKEIIEDFNKIGYEVECKILNSADYGVAQVRRRVIFIGSRVRKNIIFPKIICNNHKPIRDVLDDLPELKSGETSQIANHNAMKHTSQMLDKMSFIKDGGDRYDIPISLRPKSGDVRKYIKYDSEKPSITITGDMRKVFHYSQNRALTVRELARVQSFPDNFIFKGSTISAQQQIGNAVPPLMAEALAESIKDMIKDDNIQVIFDYQYPKVNYIGNKEKLSKWICSNIPNDTNSFFDAFSGGSSIGFEAKKRGFKVISNDILQINYCLAKSIIENKNIKLTDDDIEIIFEGKPFKGFIYKHYSEVFFFPNECMELDLYRKNIEKLSNEYKKALAFSLIRRAMVRKMPYSRFNLNWDKIKQLRDEEYSYEKYKRKRAYHNESFKSHFLKNLDDYNSAIFDNKRDNQVYNDDIFNLLDKVEADVIYLDPPYTGTMNNYYGFYGLVDEFIEQKKSMPFNNNFIDKKTVLKLFDRLFSNLSNFKYWILSYNNSAYPSKEELIEIISRYSDDIKVIEKPHNYQITGKEKKSQNTEYLFIVKNYKGEDSAKV